MISRLSTERQPPACLLHAETDLFVAVLSAYLVWAAFVTPECSVAAVGSRLVTELFDAVVAVVIVVVVDTGRHR